MNTFLRDCDIFEISEGRRQGGITEDAGEGWAGESEEEVTGRHGERAQP